jgi:hypothetical protein
MSADQIYRDWEVAYGPLRSTTVPAQRRAALTSRLQRLGITTRDFDFDRWEATLNAADPGPNADTVFLPELHFMQF